MSEERKRRKHPTNLERGNNNNEWEVEELGCRVREISYMEHVPYDHMVPTVSGEHLLSVVDDTELSNAAPTYTYNK